MESRRRVALVTGSSTGIGKAIAMRLARDGARVIVECDIGKEEGERVAEEIRTTPGGEARYYCADVSKWTDVVDLVRKVNEEYGTIDILVNNAGIIRDGLIENIEVEDWNRVMNVNLTGTFHCTKAVLGQMKEKRYGKILNIASVSAQIGNVGQANYAASKGGMIALTKTTAREAARYGINVNAIAPGFIRTRLLAKIPEKVMEKLMAQIPLSRLGEPEEVASLAAFLVSDEASYITGQVVNLSGGLYV